MSISVVIPCYNRADILARSISSALGQSLRPDEVIVVDDGSSDGSVVVAHSFGTRVRVIEQANAGAAAARNRGIESAQCDWIAFLDSDDEWHREKLAIQMAVAARFPSAQLVFCDTLVRSEDEVLMPSRFALGGLYGSEVESDGDFAFYDRSLFTRMIRQSRVITSAVLVRRDLPELRFPEHIWGSEDWALWLTLALRYRIASVDRILVTMHQQGDNISGRKGKLLRNDVCVLDDLRKDQRLTNPERSEVESTLLERRVAAVYHSLICGETSDARPLMRKVSPSDTGWPRFFAYHALTRFPGRIVKLLANYRIKP